MTFPNCTFSFVFFFQQKNPKERKRRDQRWLLSKLDLNSLLISFLFVVFFKTFFYILATGWRHTHAGADWLRHYGPVFGSWRTLKNLKTTFFFQDQCFFFTCHSCPGRRWPFSGHFFFVFFFEASKPVPPPVLGNGIEKDKKKTNKKNNNSRSFVTT